MPSFHAVPHADIPVRDRLIFALNVGGAEAEEWINRLGDSVVFYKLGLQLLMTTQFFPTVDLLIKRGKKVFADIKMWDIPDTVGEAVRQLAQHEVSFATVHGQDEMIRAAAASRGDMKILAVTVLTSFSAKDCKEVFGTDDVQSIVLSRAARMIDLGCDGVISSGLEVPALREHYGNKLVIVVPGIRPPSHKDDHQRTVDVEEAFDRGADYIVVGRPIYDAPDPRAAAEAIQARIARHFESRR